MRSKFFVSAFLAAAMVGGSLAASVPSWGDSSESEATAKACRLTVWEPSQNGAWVGGRGGRSGCGNVVGWLEVQVWKDVNNGFDEKIGSTRYSNHHNGSFVAKGKCRGASAYYTVVVTSKGYRKESAHPAMC
ncbi:hypothetical protein J2S53_001862 [Actinopolyspora lacussalsi]|nr:hypothetical protein [Actinopolyspora lacussalsi]